MPVTKIHNGKTYVLIRSSIQCVHCKDVLISLRRHDFMMCSCGLVGVDGGIELGGTILGDPRFYTDLSIWRTKTEPYEYLNVTS